MFLGREQDRNVRMGNPSTSNYHWMANYKQETPAESFWTDPERPLVCAFNFPAVTLTLGSKRWGELRGAYADLAENTSPKVHKTLTASLGEMAKIIGKVAAKQDLVPIWWKSIRAQEEEVRTKAIETLDALLPILDEEDRRSMLKEVLGAWQDNLLRGWREREMVLGLLDRFLVLGGDKACATVEGLLLKGLHDTVAAVRELAIHYVSLTVNYIWIRRTEGLLATPHLECPCLEELPSEAATTRTKLTCYSCSVQTPDNVSAIDVSRSPPC